MASKFWLLEPDLFNASEGSGRQPALGSTVPDRWKVSLIDTEGLAKYRGWFVGKLADEGWLARKPYKGPGQALN